MNLLKPLFAFFDLIREESAPLQVAAAVVFGAFFAVSPVLTPQFILAGLMVAMTRINLLVVAASYLFFAACLVPLESSFDQIGRVLLLETPALRRLWAGLYHWPVFPFTDFNNTVVLGGAVVFMLAALPLFLLSYFLYRRYSPFFFTKVQQSNMGLGIRASVLFRRYSEHVAKKQ